MENRNLLDLPAREPSSHEAQRYQDLITPFQLEAIKDFCRLLRTSPVVETMAMFGDGVNFYALHRNSAKALAMALQDRYNESRQTK